jgi:hypothetical protein
LDEISHPAPTKTSNLEAPSTCFKEKTLGIYRYERRLEQFKSSEDPTELLDQYVEWAYQIAG